MSRDPDLYEELKQDLWSLADPLFDFARLCLLEHGAFLPFGNCLLDGEVVQVAVWSAPEIGAWSHSE